MTNDIGVIEVTGLATDQIKASLEKASGAFQEDCNQKHIRGC
jgi:hypothetical protein